MLGYIQGKVLTKNVDAHSIVLLAHRMGFEIMLPQRFFDTVEVDRKMSFWLHTHVREDQLTLFGFATENEKLFFKQLLGVSGLGPKTALALLGEHSPEKLVHFILEKDADEISSAPGVGKKLAQRLILELASKIEKWAWLDKVEKSKTGKPVLELSPERQLRDDLNSALLNLGYLPTQVKPALDKVFDDEELPLKGFEVCLKTALKDMSVRHG